MDDILRAHGSARRAFAAGDFESALALSHAENDAELFACALVMCGSAERGLAALEETDASSDEALICRAYGHWLRNEWDLAATFLKRIKKGAWAEGAAKLKSKLSKRRFKVLLLMSSPAPLIEPPVKDETLEFHILEISNDFWTKQIEDLLPEGFEPDLVLSLQAYNMRLPKGIFDLAALKAFFVTDIDGELFDQYEDLSRADLLICSCLHEHNLLSRLYPAWVASLPGQIYNPVDPTMIAFQPDATPKDLDVMYSGNVFITHGSAKARFAYQMATANDQPLNIYIHDGHLDEQTYISLLSRARLVPTSSRFAGGIHSRTIDAICRGAVPLVADDRTARLLLGETAAIIGAYSEADPAKDLGELLIMSDHANANFEKDASRLKEEIAAIFPTSPLREIRLAKFALIQSIIMPSPEDKESPREPVERRLPRVWKFDPQDSDMPISHFVQLAGSSDCDQTDMVSLTGGFFDLYCSAPGDEFETKLARTAFNIAASRFPNSVALRFNRGRFLWMVGDYAAAVDEFQWIEESIQEGNMDIAREHLLFHAIRGLNEVMPYEIYHRAVINDLLAGQGQGVASRQVTLATAQLYLALDQLRNEKFDEGIRRLKTALELCPDHFPAARTMTKALWRHDDKEALQWFYRAIDLYPPYLNELLPFGVELERRIGSDDKAFKIIENWALFITRVEWSDPDRHRIFEDAVDAARPYFDRLPPELEQPLMDRLERLLP